MNQITNYNDLLTDLETLKTFECHLTIKPDVMPYVDPCRRVPFALQQKFKKNQRMVDMNLIEKMTDPTDKVSLIVIVGKANGKIKICIDPRKLNKAIIRHYYPLLTLDEIRSDLVRVSYFLMNDAISGFWMLKLCNFS